MKNRYNSEIEGMIDFYKELGISKNVDYSCNTDGSINGCIIEFKLNFDKLLSHKNQVERYLKAYNAIAKKIPAKALLVDINAKTYIEGDVSTFNGGVYIDWNTVEQDWSTPNCLALFLDLHDYCKGWIDETSLISYNNLYCEINNKKTTSKGEVQTELVNPQLLNIHPFDWQKQLKKEKEERSNNNWLTFNMNMLGSESLKKKLGAFFTPDKYVKISTQYVREAIKNVPEGMDYVVIDRCAGSGNLEKYFTGEELQHFILNTIDYTEWTTLRGLYQNRVKHIIPPSAVTRDNKTGLMSGGDALQEDFYKKLLPLIKGKYIIMLENPPFAGTSGIRGGAKGTLKNKKYSYVNLEMKKNGYDGNVCKDLLTQFVWSAFELIKCHEYILYSPIMWWKSNHILDKKYIKGHMCNKKAFNAKTSSGLLLGHWLNQDLTNSTLKCSTDIENFTYSIKKKNSFITNLLDDHKISIDKNNLRVPEPEELGLLFSTSSTLDALNGGLFNRNTYRTELVTSAGLKLSKITSTNIKNLSVIQCVNCYSTKEYYEKEVVMKSCDLLKEYESDTKLLNDCFLYVLLSAKTKCTSNNTLNNQLCLLQNTIADKLLLKDYKKSNLVDLWKEVLDEVKKGNKPEYNKSYNYGLYQIDKEINIKIPTGNFNKKGEPTFKKKYPVLDEKIDKLKKALDIFYKAEIKDKLFKYELLK